MTAELVLLCALGVHVGGPLLRPARRRWSGSSRRSSRSATGSSADGPRPTSTPIFHREFLPYAFGFDAAGAVAAGALLLARGLASCSAPLARGRRSAPRAAAGRAAGAAALAHPRVVAGARRARARATRSRGRPRALLVAAAAALARPGRARALPPRARHPSRLAHDRAQHRPVPRVLVEPPLPRVPAARGPVRARAALAAGGRLLRLGVRRRRSSFTLGRPLEPAARCWSRLVAGLPVYALLTASIVFCDVPRVERRRASRAQELGAGARRQSSTVDNVPGRGLARDRCDRRSCVRETRCRARSSPSPGAVDRVLDRCRRAVVAVWSS